MGRKYKAIFAKGPRTRKQWYRIDAKGETAEVLIYDEIGLWGIDAKQFTGELNALDVGRLVVRINSPGGSVFDGVAIYNALARHRATVEVHVDGLAASIASIIAMAGDEVHMGTGAFFMVHDPSMIAWGTAEEMRKSADLLDKVAGEMVEIYADRTGMEVEEIRDVMLAETWYTAAEAVEAGFATHMDAAEEDEEMAPAAAWDLSVFANVPVALAEEMQKRVAPTSVREVEAVLRDAGLSRSQATAVASRGWKEGQRDAAQTAEEIQKPTQKENKVKTCDKCGSQHDGDVCAVCAKIEADRQRSAELLALGQRHGHEAMAQKYVTEGRSVDALREAILAAMPEPKPVVSPKAPGGEVEVGATLEEARPWGSFGEQLQAVVRASGPGASMDPRLGVLAAASGANEGSDSEGGFLVSPQFVPGLIQDMHDDDEIVKRCAKVGIGPGHNGIRANGVDESSRATGSRWGGVQVYWASEAGTATATKPKFRQIKMDLEKLLGFYYATDEVLTDSVQLGALASQAFREEIGFATADAVVRGSGAGQPLGLLNADATVSQAKETGQAADTIVFENVSKMWARLRARNRANSVWLVNQECGPQLEQMYVAVGTGGIPVWMPAGGVSGQPYETLKGRPVLYVEQASALGDVGDIILADLSEYLLIDKQGVQEDQSIHVRFLYDEMTFRFVYRVNGQPFRSSAITPYKGASTLSPFVTLAARA